MSPMPDAPPRPDVEAQIAKSDGAFPATAGQPSPVSDGAFFNNIARHPWKLDLVSLPTLADRGESTEQFRGLRSQIYQFLDQGPLKTILVSSGLPNEGKSFVAANLAMSLARNKNHHVLLIDADMRSPSLHTIFSPSNTAGLTEYLAGTAEISDILQRNQNPTITDAGGLRGIPDIAFISGGHGGDNASELIANHRVEELIAALAPHFDWILIDTPPVLVFADAVDLARAADAVLLVARGASTPYDVAQRAQAAFSNSRILGFVLNAVKNAPRSSSYYHYYGDYGRNEHGGSHRETDKRG